VAPAWIGVLRAAGTPGTCRRRLGVGGEQWAPELLLDLRLGVVASRHGVHAGGEPREAQAVEGAEHQGFGQFPLDLGDRLKCFAEHVGRDPLVDVPAGLQVRP
jgi:hypothetical protein